QPALAVLRLRGRLLALAPGPETAAAVLRRPALEVQHAFGAVPPRRTVRRLPRQRLRPRLGGVRRRGPEGGSLPCRPPEGPLSDGQAGCPRMAARPPRRAAFATRTARPATAPARRGGSRFRPAPADGV